MPNDFEDDCKNTRDASFIADNLSKKWKAPQIWLQKYIGFR